MVHSSSSSGIFFEGDEQSHSQSLRNSNVNSYMNSNLAPQTMYSNMASNGVMDSMGSSGLSIGASSLVTDANSALSGGTPCIQRSTSINNESSYMRLPASPLSFSSNNLTISNSSVIDSQSPNSNQDPNFHQMYQQSIRQGASTATSSIFPGSFMSDHDHVQKKPRIDIKQDEILQQQFLRQMLQRQEPNPFIQSQNTNAQTAQLQALYQQRQLLQSLPPGQRAHLLQQQQLQQQQQILSRQNLQQSVNRSYEGGVCSRRLMQYLYHQRHKPADISYWRKFVGEYYSPRAKKRWCLALHNNVGHHPVGVFSPSNMDIWQCGICGSKSGRGFEATFEVLARLNEIKFSSGVIDELWFLDLPRESRFPSGIMMLEYGKAVQESVYEQLRVVHEGRLKVIFAPDLKILSWEFCSRRHEELLPRRLVSNQVNQLLEVAQKWQSTVSESGSGGVSPQDLQANSNMIVAAGRQLARSLELPSVNDLGFTKTYVRCLQTSEVVNSMMDLVDITRDTKMGPIEALKSFQRMKKAQGIGQVPNIGDQNMLMRQRLMNLNSQQSGGRVVQNNSGYPGGVFQVQQQNNQQQQSKPSVSGQSVGEASRSNSYKGGSHSDSCVGGDVRFEDIGSDFVDSMFINEAEDAGVGYGWK